MPTLLLSSRHTDDNQALWRAAIRREWSVVRARGIRLPEIEDSEIILYVEALFAPTIAGLLGRKLLELREEWLVHIPFELRKREIELMSLGQARKLTEPAFVKPPNDKIFPAQVYQSGQDLPVEFDDELSVLVAEPVQWEVEFRCFCLNGTVKTVSPYLRSGRLAKLTGYEASAEELNLATLFAESVLDAADSITPKAVVIDVGKIAGQGWAVVEANAAWGSGIYGCAPDKVLDVIRHAIIDVV